MATLICEASGDWEKAKCVIKDCGSLKSVSDGSVSLDSSATTFGSTATVSCSVGYVPKAEKITCKESGVWEEAQCIIKDCGSLPSISDGSVRLDSTATTFGSTATVSCNIGYDPSVATIRCQASGAWDIAACTIKDCGTLPSISDGSMRLDSTTTTFGSTATVSCNIGYDPSVATIRCQASGAWDLAACTIKDCGTLPSISDGSVRLDSTTTTFGSTATVSCNVGYDPSVATIRCQASGAWDLAACTIKDCGTLPSISDGSVRLDSTTTTFGSTATVSCNVGYDPSVATIRCQASGAWDLAACTIKDCGTLPSISDGSVRLDSTTTTFGSTATVSCNVGYDPSVATIRCQASGAWDLAACTIKDCGTLPSISDGSVRLDSTTTTFGSTATVSCNVGYDPSVATIRCQASGAWDLAACTIKDCGTLPSISDGSMRLDSTTTTFGSTATVSCNVGYDPSVATIRCQASGAWDLAACTIKDCGTLPSISDGSVRLDSTTTTFGSTATVSCNVGYDPSVATIRCQASGAWD
ncbi:sushi, von Willebrand factor type A, EGF and pentraxin domain-containing protein 1-like isoform X2 [Mercenaria mercenaria]|uniref:sushi, von Willebrand factor type A, EGF and pentraxin domain-containing protein 1-like isoform X2 n=1 Tax=Mercenaria mercenaria TaxID=6596 RepID=UPI00234F80CD|nr:sushi, von Willebrand factor type A, EGF and pentraxin domain-containing protein 1-like isoform X2 [Mercenaria mercenaria]